MKNERVSERKERFREYAMEIRFSPEDECYVARAPAFQFVAAHGDTPGEALKELETALEGVIESMEADGQELPESDLLIAEIRRFEPILNKSKLAERAGMNKHTLASKLRRKSRFTPEETSKLRDAIYG